MRITQRWDEGVAAARKGSGLFDQYPKLAIILGHMGEGLPFSMWRVDNCNAWIPNRHDYAAKKKIAEYFQANFHITVSGNFCTPALTG